jgi:large conductance mechanosensitive channel
VWGKVKPTFSRRESGHTLFRLLPLKRHSGAGAHPAVSNGLRYHPTAELSKCPEQEARMAMLEEFKRFAVKGSMIDLAVGVIIGAAFSKIVESLVQDIIMPPISVLVGGLDFSSYYIPLKNQAAGLPLAEARKLGAVFAYGNFLTVLLNFLILAFIIFQMVRLVNRLRSQPEAAGPAEEILLLRDIRDSLKK